MHITRLGFEPTTLAILEQCLTNTVRRLPGSFQRQLESYVLANPLFQYSFFARKTRLSSQSLHNGKTALLMFEGKNSSFCFYCCCQIGQNRPCSSFFDKTINYLGLITSWTLLCNPSKMPCRKLLGLTPVLNPLTREIPGFSVVV